ncbi:hypothetical protein KZC31_07065, partial [Salmonella enterica subsp. enterica serovar Javiana]|nr:hypothetical protein [Salmonella enterica subsp. enterica serovar Javiana]
MMWRVFCLELRVGVPPGAGIPRPPWVFPMGITPFSFNVGAPPPPLARIAPGIIQGLSLLHLFQPTRRTPISFCVFF